MTDHPTYPTRRRLRLEGYNYSSAGMYFVTVCVQDRQPLLGTIRDGVMEPSAAGVMVQEVWDNLPHYSPGMATDAFIVMPDHIHGIVVLDDQRDSPSPRSALPAVLQRYKSYTTAKYRAGVYTAGWPRFPGTLWQRSYFERVIRNERELDAARVYITENVAKWQAQARENGIRS